MLLRIFQGNNLRGGPRKSPRWLSPLLLLAVSAPWLRAGERLSPPKTRTDDVREVIHGVQIADPYRWLEDQESPETRAWINAQNKYSRALLDSWPRREALKRRLTELLRVDTVSVPTVRGGRYFFLKRSANQEQAILYMRKALNGKNQVLIDPNPLSPDHNVAVSLRAVSEDGSLVAYSLRRGGEDETPINVLDVDAGRELPDRLPKGRYFSVSFKSDHTGFYYSLHTAAGPRVYYHAMGTNPAKDTEIFGKGYGTDKIIEARLSDEGRYLLIQVEHGSAADQTEVYVQDIRDHGPIVPIVNDLPARFEGEIGGQQLFLHTNWKAPRGRILAVDLKNPARNHWREVIPQGEAAIESLTLAGGELFVDYLQDAHSHLRVFDAAGKYLRDFELPSLGTVQGFEGRWSDGQIFFDFTSFNTAGTIYRYDVKSEKQSIWARIHVPIHSERFEVRQVWYESKDKTRVPMFLMCRKGIKFDGSNPTLLTGYGGFNISMTPTFSASAALWVEQGGVFALPNLRGGGEFGEAWHRAGMLGNKQNVFDDFIAAAEWLIRNHYTRPSKLAISGRSNGGLLVGAALTQRPDLFRAVVCGYPLLDMLRYQKFFVAKYWVSEYGSADNAAQFKYLDAYSPYQHVKAGTKYPAVLLVSGDGDTRVAPLHARKMTALLQAATGSDRPILLHYDTEAGHSHGVSVTKQIDEAAVSMGFLFWQLNAPFAAAR